MSRPIVATLLLFASHLAVGVLVSLYHRSLRRPRPRRKDLAPGAKRRRTCPLCCRFVSSDEPHDCPHRLAQP